MSGTGQQKSIAEATFGLRNIPWFDYDPEAVRIFKGEVRSSDSSNMRCAKKFNSTVIEMNQNSDRQKRPLEKLY